MRKSDILREPVLKQTLITQLLNFDERDNIDRRPLSRIILTRYCTQGASQKGFSQCFSQGGGTMEIQSQASHIATGDQYYYKASDGFQQIEAKFGLDIPERLDLFTRYQSSSEAGTVSLFTVVEDYEFIVQKERIDNQNKRCIQLAIKSFDIHSMHERLTSDILQAPDNLPQLQKDPEIITYLHYLNHCELKKKATRMIVKLVQFKLNPIVNHSSEEKGIEPIRPPQVVKEEILLTKQEDYKEADFRSQGAGGEIDYGMTNPYYNNEDDSEEVELVQQTESEDLDCDGSNQGNDRSTLNENIQLRIKQLLGASINKSRTASVSDHKKLGRGKWHYTTDQKYGFNVSYSNGDTIISMGQVFIIQTPKMSISSKYRGYPIPVIEPKVELPQQPMFRTMEYKPEGIIEQYTKNDGNHHVYDINDEEVKVEDTYYHARGPVFQVYTYFNKEEVERQRSQAILEGLKYEEEFLSHKIKLQLMRKLKQQHQQQMQLEQTTGSSSSINHIFKTESIQEVKDEPSNTYECENDDSYASDNNQFGLESNNSPRSTLNVNNDFKSENKNCNFFVDSKYFGHSKILKTRFSMKNTIQKIFKYGTKELFRLSNQTLLEKFDDAEDALLRLRNEPLVYGNQKRKRMVKYYDRVKKFIKRLNIKGDPSTYDPSLNTLQKEEQVKQKIAALTMKDVHKFQTWCDYQESREYYSQAQKTKFRVKYDASDFYGMNHNFQLKLMINIERPKIATLSPPKVQKQSCGTQTRQHIDKDEDKISPKMEVIKQLQPKRKIDIEIPIFQKDFMQQPLHPHDEDEDEKLLRDFCKNENTCTFEYEQQDQQLLLDFDPFNNFNTHQLPQSIPQSSQCDFTVQLSENEEDIKPYQNTQYFTNSYSNPGQTQQQQPKHFSFSGGTVNGNMYI